ncbi:hypothetical protein ACFQV2_19550 [Actinokineospora soli]|uniref:Beta/Gamma crystallin n=1 Tax=Actinokineospora soli TaxID=1048753 RepID=A0ABW2TNJ9_9PSEU
MGNERGRVQPRRPDRPQVLRGHRDGAGQQVKNNATHISCDASTTTICYVFYNSRYSGPSDHLYGQSSGRLADTYSENASVRISWGA